MDRQYPGEENKAFGSEELEPNPCYNIGIMVEKKKTPAGSSFWQIIFPAVVGVLLVLLLGLVVVLYISPGNVSRFAEISTVLLVIPVLFSSFLVMLLLGALIALVYKITQGLPTITGWILDKSERVQKVVQAGSKTAAVPVVRPAAFLAGFRRIFTKNKSRD